MNYTIPIIFLISMYNNVYSFIPIETKIKIIEFSSKILPRVDTIGHKLLLNNEVVIKHILDFEKIPLDIRKQLVLNIIRFTEYGDKFGGFILSNYHDIVDKLL
jgi:hypothetical protein